jgi:hypothetical protein
LFHTYQTEFTAGAKEVITRAMEDIHTKANPTWLVLHTAI